MSIFYQEEPPNPSNRCKCLASALKDAFAKCQSFRAKLPSSNAQEEEEEEEEEPVCNFDDEDEIFVSAIISKYMESKSKRKSINGIDAFYWDLSPPSGDSIIIPKAAEKNASFGENGSNYFSASSRLSRCSSDRSFDVFLSAKTCLSRCMSLNRIDYFQDFMKRRSIILEFVHCEGWPFGLCRKALLLPPLPKSPSDSWCWRKSTGGMIKTH